MKNSFAYLLLFVAIITLSFVACRDDEKESITVDDEKELIEVEDMSSAINGLWCGVDFDKEDDGVWVDITSSPNDEFAFTFEFGSDGRFNGTGFLGNGGGEYTMDEDIIKIYKEDNFFYALCYVEEMTKTSMILIIDMQPDLSVPHSVFRFKLERVE